MLLKFMPVALGLGGLNTLGLTPDIELVLTGALAREFFVESGATYF